MLGFLTDQLKKNKLPENDLLPEEKDYYLKLLVALSQGDFEILNTAFHQDDSGSDRLLTLRFEKYINDMEKTPPKPELQEVLDNQVSLKTFISRMVKY